MCACSSSTDRQGGFKTNKQTRKKNEQTRRVPKLGSAAFSLHFQNIRVLLRVVVNRIYMFVCLFVFPVLLQICKILRENFVTFCKMGATRPPKILLVFFFLKKNTLGFSFFLVYFCWTLKKKKNLVPACVREQFSFFCSWWFFALSHLSPLFVLNQSGATTKKGKTRKRREKKDGPVGNTSVTCSSHRHWTSARHFPAERRGGRERREEEGGLRFTSNQI